MPWNQPRGNARRVATPKGGNARLPMIVGCIGLAALVAWLTIPKAGREQDVAPKVAGEIKAVKPVKSLRPATDVAEAPKPKAGKAAKPQRVGEVRDGYRLLCDGTLHKVNGVITNTPGRFSVSDRTFRHSADVELGNLLLVEPGDDLLGDSAGMYKGFRKELLEALEEDITYTEEDTPFQRELKDSVKELRDELGRRMQNGEDVERVMEDTRNQLKELSLYRQELEEEVRRLSTDEMTQKDYEDLVKAANEMLAERGVKALEMPRTLRHAIRLKKLKDEGLRNVQEVKDEK